MGSLVRHIIVTLINYVIVLIFRKSRLVRKERLS